MKIIAQQVEMLQIEKKRKFSRIFVEIKSTITHKTYRKSNVKKVNTKMKKKKSHETLNENDMKIIAHQIEMFQIRKKRRLNE